MPIDDLTALGQKMREARKNKELTELSEKFEMKRGKQAPLNTEFHSMAARSPFHSGRH